MEMSNSLSLTREPIFSTQNDNLFLKTNLLFSNEINIFDLDSERNKEEKKKIFFTKKLESFENSLNSIYVISKNGKNESQSTFKTSNNIFNISKNSIQKKKNIFFKTVLHHKRGRKEKNRKYGKKSHGAGDFDNIQRKIQVSFINFLIKLANDAIKTVFGQDSKYCFKDIKYKYKKVVRHNYLESLKLCKYSDIIQMSVSPKIKSYRENSNKETYMEICTISPELENLFDKNYLYIFQKYFCGIKNNQDIIDFDGLKVKLSPHTKGLLNLLRENVDKKEAFKDIIKKVYFSDSEYLINNKYIKSNPFIIFN